MSNFEMPVELYMTEHVHTISPTTSLEDAHHTMSGLAVSSLPLVDGNQQLTGVITRTDLIRVGRRQAGSRPKADLLTLPDMAVKRRATREVVTVGPKDPLSVAAQKMMDGHLHRVFVTDQDRLVGVLSTQDLMLAIRDKRISLPISELMSSPIFSVRANDPVSLATERLQKAHVTCLVVMNDGWPVGLFTQREALEAHDRPRDTHVDQVMSSALLALDHRTPLYRAAAQAAEMEVRYIIAVNGRCVLGILTGLDFARATTWPSNRCSDLKEVRKSIDDH